MRTTAIQHIASNNNWLVALSIKATGFNTDFLQAWPILSL